MPSPAFVALAMTLALATLLGLAVRSDLRRHRIPNTVVAVGLVTGLALQSALAGWAGLRTGLLGAAAGLAVFLPFYLLRGMGAGDVKLAAAAGSFLGPAGALFGALASLVAGAICAVIWVIVGRRAAREAGGATESGLRQAKFPYAVAIAMGMLSAAAAQWPRWST